MFRGGLDRSRCLHLSSPMVRVCKPKPIGMATLTAPWNLRSSIRKLRLAIRIKLLQIHIAIWQRVEMHGAEERARRLDQQNRFGKTVVVKAFAEVHAGLDGKRAES